MEDAQHLAQRYARMRQEAEAQETGRAGPGITILKIGTGPYPARLKRGGSVRNLDNHSGDVSNSLDGSTSWKNLDNHSGDDVGGTGIKIRARHPQLQPKIDSFVDQGSAARRLHLLVDHSVGSINHGFDPDGRSGIMIRTLTNATMFSEIEG
ncbi:hypothetical protein FF1_042441 [Malus domestica]